MQNFLILAVLLHVAAYAGDLNIVTIDGQTFTAEIARTSEQKVKGLMFRENLPGNACMFFLYDNDSNRAIWMKDCKIPLDVVWVNGEGRVVEVQENIPPCPTDSEPQYCPQYGGRVTSRHFIEFPAGTVSKAGIKLGDIVFWDLSVPQEGRWLFTPGLTLKPIFIKNGH